MSKKMLVHAIIGGQMPSYKEIDEFEKTKLVYFSGNQWVPDWSWSKENLEKLSTEELLAIYDRFNTPS